MIRYIFIICILLAVPGGIILSNSFPATTVSSIEKSHNLQRDRKMSLLSYWADQTLPEWQGWESKDSFIAKPTGPAKVAYPNIALAKLAADKDIENVNESLVNADAYSGVGSHVPILRDGDYDFSLFILTAIAHEFWNTPQLATSTKVHLAKNLLNQEGPVETPEYIYGYFPETENHVLMTEISRYLKNQLVTSEGMQYRSRELPKSAYNNETNGVKEFLLEYMKEILSTNFDEYNSKPYEVYTLSSVQTLYEYATDPEMKTAAQNVLDYHALRYALQSMDLRRIVPFRRQAKHIGLDYVYERDAGAARYALLVGNQASTSAAQKRQLQNRARSILAVGSYDIPNEIKDLMISTSDNPYLYWSFYDNAEIVHREENFLISAGGIYHNKYRFPFFSHMDGLPRQTVVMFKQGSTLISDMIRFEGAPDIKKRNNTCVFVNFACGLRPELPQGVKEEARDIIESDEWTYLQTHNSYVAFYQNKNTATGTSFGFTEVTDSSNFSSLSAFKEVIEDSNKDKEFVVDSENTYTTSAGVEITFQIKEDVSVGLFASLANLLKDDKMSWQIKNVKNSETKVYPQENIRQWSTLKAVNLDTGEMIAFADGDGSVLVNNSRHQNPLYFGVTASSSFRLNSVPSSSFQGYWKERK